MEKKAGDRTSSLGQASSQEDSFGKRTKGRGGLENLLSQNTCVQVPWGKSLNTVNVHSLKTFGLKKHNNEPHP